MNFADQAPIVLFVFNRPGHTLRTLEALEANPLAAQSPLYVFCDGPRLNSTQEEIDLVANVRQVVRSRAWCGSVTIHERPTNLGLADSIREGLDAIFTASERAIVLEDDIVTSPGFLRYMNDALNAYDRRPPVMHITGYLPETNYQWILPDTFLARYMSCWGWATWRNSWNKVRWNGSDLLKELDRYPGGRRGFDIGGTTNFSQQLEANVRGELRTWAVYWGASIYLAGGLCLFPRRSLVRNIGTDGSGENFRTDQSGHYDAALAENITVKPGLRAESARGRAYLRSFHRYGRSSSLGRRALLALGRAKHRLASRLNAAA